MLTSVCRALSLSSAIGAGPGRVGNVAATFSQGFLSVCREGGKGQESRPQDVSGPLFLSVGPGEPRGAEAVHRKSDPERLGLRLHLESGV